MKEEFCPCCGRHCPSDSLRCERGVAYANAKNETSDNNRGRNGDWLRARRECYQSLDADNKLICNIRDIGHTVRMLSDGKASQSRILIILSEEKAITQSQLTERLRVQPGSVSEVIGKLERAGLIERVASDNDRRTCELRLTSEGVERAMQAREERKTRYEKMFCCLTDSEKSDLLVLLEKVNADWERQYADKRERRHCGHHHGEHSHGEHHQGEYCHGEHSHGERQQDGYRHGEHYSEHKHGHHGSRFDGHHNE